MVSLSLWSQFPWCSDEQLFIVIHTPVAFYSNIFIFQQNDASREYVLQNNFVKLDIICEAENVNVYEFTKIYRTNLNLLFLLTHMSLSIFLSLYFLLFILFTIFYLDCLSID